MNKVVRTCILLVLIWAMPISMWLTPFSPNRRVREFVDTELGTVENGIGVSVIYMILPTIMSIKIPFPWEIDCTFRNIEIYIVMLLCIFRASTAVVVFRHAAIQSCHWYLASIVALCMFFLTKNYQKINPMNAVLYALSWFNILALIVCVVCIDVHMTTLLFYTELLRGSLLFIIVFGEFMYAVHVEKKQCPNNYMLCSMLLIAVCDGSRMVIQLLSDYNEESISSGFLGFAFILYYFGFRTQENRLLSDVVNRFEEVVCDDDDQLL